MSSRSAPRIVTLTLEQWVGVTLARPGYILLSANVPTPAAARSASDSSRFHVWPEIELNATTAFTGEFLGLRVAVFAVPNHSYEWSISMHYGAIRESSAFRIEQGRLCWQPDERAAAVATQSAAAVS